MTYLTTPFPEKISRGAVGGPLFPSTVVMTGGGQRYVNQSSNQPLRYYDVSHAARKAESFAELLAFFYAARGPMHSFPFKDWLDYQITASQGVFSAITATTFQMKRRYTFGGANQDVTVLKPKQGTVVITGGVSPTTDYATGIVTVTSGTPTAYAAETYVPCHFEIEGFRGDLIDGTIQKRILGWSGIQIAETRNP